MVKLNFTTADAFVKYCTYISWKLLTLMGAIHEYREIIHNVIYNTLEIFHNKHYLIYYYYFFPIC